jgi:hypothetical protein
MVSMRERSITSSLKPSNCDYNKDFYLDCNLCGEYILFGCPRVTCQATGAVGIGAWINNQSFGTQLEDYEHADEDEGDDSYKTARTTKKSGKCGKKRSFSIEFFTYSMAWQPAVCAFLLTVNFHEFEWQLQSFFTGDPVFQLSGGHDGLDAIHELFAAIHNGDDPDDEDWPESNPKYPGSMVFSAVPINQCAVPHHIRRYICNAQHCIDHYDRKLNRRRGKGKSPRDRRAPRGSK